MPCFHIFFPSYVSVLSLCHLGSLLPLFLFLLWFKFLLSSSSSSSFSSSFALFFPSPSGHFHKHLHFPFPKHMSNPRGTTAILSRASVSPRAQSHTLSVCMSAPVGTLRGKHCFLLVLPSTGTHVVFQENPLLFGHWGHEHMKSACQLANIWRQGIPTPAGAQTQSLVLPL